MIRCKPLLGTFVEIRIEDALQSSQVLNEAFLAIEQVQSLMGFHNPESELSQINTSSYLEPIHIHPWTTEVLSIAKEMYQLSNDLFNCGVGHLLVEAGLLPKYVCLGAHAFGGIEDFYSLSQAWRTPQPHSALILGDC